MPARAIGFIAFVGIAAGLWGCQSNGGPAPGDRRVLNTQVIEDHWPNGQLRTRRHVLREEDGTLMDYGLYTCWYRSGQKEYEGRYDEGRLDGVETRWHENGEKATEQEYRMGLRHGYRRDWDPSGRLRKEEQYADDLPHGVWSVWKDNGDVKWQQVYRHGRPVDARREGGVSP
jgi:hypothetical protein